MSNGARKRLLVVDDEKAIRHLLTRIAERAGFQVDAATDGMEALDLLRRHEYAIAIVDLMMPRLSGYELVQKISELEPRPVVLVATAMADADVATLDDSMVRRVIRKPFDIAAVAKALIETAKQIAEQQAEAPAVVKVIPPAPPAPPASEEPEGRAAGDLPVDEDKQGPAANTNPGEK